MITDVAVVVFFTALIVTLTAWAVAITQSLRRLLTNDTE